MSEDNLGIEFTNRIIEKYPHIFTNVLISKEHPEVCAQMAHVLGGLMSIILHKKGEDYYRQCLTGLLGAIDKTARETVFDALDIAHNMECPKPPTARYTGRAETPEES